MQNTQENTKVITEQELDGCLLPPRRVVPTPKPLQADAYTIGSESFQSQEAKTKSTYYLTFRRRLHDINPDLYDKGDDRIVFTGLPRILEKLFYTPVTHADIDLSIRALQTAKVTTTGLQPYNFPEHLWRRIVDEFNGRPPISIRALPEGSIVYPNEPVIQITNLIPEFGELAAYPESKLAQTWASTERVTQARHWLKEMIRMVHSVEPDLCLADAQFKASCMLHDFGDRAGMGIEESEEQGLYHLLTNAGTDTFCGGFQAWHWDGFTGDEPSPGIFLSVLALAHRNVQAYEFENDCYVNMYETAKDGEILSMVADCYDFYNAVENYLLPLAMRAKKECSGKVIVARPDSGDALEQVTWVCRLAKRHGLCTEREIGGKAWYFPTNLHFIEGDGMDFGMMKKICAALIEQGFPPYAWGLFGVGGGLRNNLKRDNLSAKYALNAMLSPRVKFSETIGKTTLPGPFKLLRSPEALAAKKTIVFTNDPGDDAMVEHFNGTNLAKPFGDIMWERFRDVHSRIDTQFPTMPLSLETADNHNYPASDAVRAKRLELLAKYAPKKRRENY